jgi:hypothetical protein
MAQHLERLGHEVILADELAGIHPTHSRHVKTECREPARWADACRLLRTCRADRPATARTAMSGRMARAQGLKRCQPVDQRADERVETSSMSVDVRRLPDQPDQGYTAATKRRQPELASAARAHVRSRAITAPGRTHGDP